MIATIRPSRAEGTMTAPPSKSMAHRMILCAGLAKGISTIRNLDASEDILATMDCLRALGAEIQFEDRTAVIRGTDPQNLLRQADSAAVSGTDPRGMEGAVTAGGTGQLNLLRQADSAVVSGADPRDMEGAEKTGGTDPRNLLRQADSAVVLRCRESGSTLRFLIPFCLLPGRRIQLTGSGKLFTRPLSVYREICREQDLLFDQREASLTVEGRLAAGRYQVPGDISSQFISGLLFALPLLEKDSEIALTPPVESRPYIEMTMQALREAGVRTAWRDPLTIQIPGNQVYSPVDTAVEGDYSNAAFFEALNLTGGDVRVEGLRKDSLQGDRVYRQAFEQIRAGSARIDLSDCPDLGPVLMAAAALFEGAVFTGTRRLRIKESDRGEAMREELSKLGVRVDVSENEISVFPGLRRPREILDGHNDHRIVMALAVLLTKTGGSIRGAEAVKKSLPDFFERIRKLGIDVNQVTEGTGEAQER